MENQLFAFVLMPFADEFNDIYKLGIQETAAGKNVIAERIDEQIYSESILERIYRQIDTADFIIADMTDKNANVFYEVGYAHAKEKICTLITRSADDIPFDLKHHRHIIYGGSITKLKEQLATEIEWIKAEIENRKTTKFEVKCRNEGAVLEILEYSRTGTVDMIFDIHNRTSKRSPEIDAIYVYTSDNWKIRQENKLCAFKKSDKESVTRCHLIEVNNMKRLGEGAWMQIRCELERDFWRKWFNDEVPEDKYHAKGFILFEIATDEGTFIEKIDLDIVFDEIPF